MCSSPFRQTGLPRVPSPDQGSSYFTVWRCGIQPLRSLGDVAPDLARRPEAVTFDQPLLGGSPSEITKGVGPLRAGREGMYPEQVLLQEPYDPLGEAIAFRCP
jgi:hypothetical protein